MSYKLNHLYSIGATSQSRPEGSYYIRYVILFSIFIIVTQTNRCSKNQINNVVFTKTLHFISSGSKYIYDKEFINILRWIRMS